MPVSLAGKPCLDPRELYVSCRDTNLSTEWASGPNAPNSFACPLGTTPGTGQVLMSLSSLQAISPDGTFPGLYDLVFGNSAGSVKLKNLVVVSAECLTPGGRGGESAYLVSLADRRLLLARVLVNAAYNVSNLLNGLHPNDPALSRAPTATIPGTGVPFDLWDMASALGPWPGLPAGWAQTFDPGASYLDENLEFWQTPILDALALTLGRIGCALRYDPTADTFGIVVVGAADPINAGSVARLEAAGLRVWDDYNLRPARGSVPATVRVLFRILPAVQGEGTPWHAVDVAGGVAGADPGSVVAIEDDTCYYSAGMGLTANDAQVNGRAADMAADYYRQLAAKRAGGRVVYAGALSDPGILPGSLVARTRWSETASGIAPGAGLVTEVVPPEPDIGVKRLDLRQARQATAMVWLTSDAIPTGPGGAGLGGYPSPAPPGTTPTSARCMGYVVGLVRDGNVEFGGNGPLFESVMVVQRPYIYSNTSTGHTDSPSLVPGMVVPCVPTGLYFGGFAIYMEVGAANPLKVKGGGVSRTPIDTLTFRDSVVPTFAALGGPDTDRVATVALVNDEASPGPNMVYGTDASGVKGWVPCGCGGGSGPGSVPVGSGGELLGPFAVPCCPPDNPIPKNLHATITGGGTCNGSFAITSATGAFWSGSYLGAILYFDCDDGTDTFSCSDSFGNYTLVSSDCVAQVWVFTGNTGAFACSIVPYTITITV